ncbi:glycosylphosphatidylinositol anchor attachment 1 [Stylonychia lemnae]|uniref:Glycosylphosphatidylinositol anchor attachment 1 n=1 Tax=Stylonychia lemnae TaxID=5949 RepID=A0A078A056_STYLE|nr:glycosylphosphatidylinositol anchor attachment 1 [Stylonychia lemnae]|eukprot:CDW75530.1 glycosylphosphatidylinositol anchor attachment 1 [Stylonychia lemnae]
MIFLGILWILTFPYISRNVFTSENALNGEFLETSFGKDAYGYSAYKTIQEQLKSIDPRQGYRDFILQRLASKTEVYIQQLKNKKTWSVDDVSQLSQGNNVYAYLRSPQGYGNECNLLAMPINHKPSVAIGLAFMEVFLKNQPKWQSKDILVLFYEENNYALSVKEFLDSYFYQESSKDFFSKRIEGRCGYIRQAYTFVFQEYEFNKLSVFADGKNSELPDIDFYDTSMKVIGKNNFAYDFSLPYYFRKNPYIERASSWAFKNMRDWYFEALKQILPLFNFQVNTKGSFLQMIESIKNQYIGRPHMPHTHFISHGIHSMTIKGTYDPKQKQAFSNDRERVPSTLGLFEHLFRVIDQLDEQLHAGFYFYIFTSKTTFISNNNFVYPIVLILVGYFVPILIDRLEKQEHDEEYAKDAQSMRVALIFTLLTYAIGYFILLLPGFYMEFKGINDQVSDLCLGPESIKRNLTDFMLLSIAGIVITFLVVFKTLQPKNMKYLWFNVKYSYWLLNPVFSGSLVVYQFSQSLLHCVFIFAIVSQATYIGQGMIKFLISVAMMGVMIAFVGLTLFGTLIIHNDGKTPLQILQGLVQETILDYQCVGSNVWSYICLFYLTSFIMMAKIITN